MIKSLLGGDFMTEKSYLSVQNFFINHKFSFNLLNILYKYLPALVFIVYPIFLTVYGFLKGFLSLDFLKVFLLPLTVFIFVTIFRKLLNFKRPYEKFNFPPLIPKDKKGQSFPSRHVTSAFIISMAFLYVNTILGITFLIISALIALTRLLAGVHFIKDVIIAAIFSIIVGYIFLFII